MKLNANDSEATLSSNFAGHNDIDWHKLKVVANKSMPWIGLFLIICLASSFILIRYTKPLFESYSEIKLGREEKSNILNLPGLDQGSSYALLSSEMELITSRLFFNKIIESVRLSPQYFASGQFLDDEKYSTPPFLVDYQLKNISLYNTKIYISIIDTSRFLLTYELQDKEFQQEFRFDGPIATEDFEFDISLSPTWNSSMGTEFYFIIKSHDALMVYIETNLSVEPVNFDANIFKISFKDHNVNKAHALISAIDTLYYQYSLNEKNMANKNKIEYLNSQLADTEEKLDDFEKYFENVTITDRTVSLDEDVRRTVTLINALDSQQVRIKKDLVDLNNLANEVKIGQIVIIPTINEKFPAHLISLINELNLLINEREKLGLSYRENTYTYKSRQKEIDLLKADLLGQIDNIKSNVAEDGRYLANQKISLNRQLKLLPSKNTEFNKVKRFYTLYEEVYLSLIQSKNQFEIAMAGSTTKIKILSPATMPNSPIKPNKIIVYGSGGAIFAFLSILFMAISYLAHDKIDGINDLERNTNATILGSVPRYKANGKHAKIIVHEHPKSAISESMRSIRTNMEFIHPESKAKVYSFTSTIGSEGKTFISTNMAALIAMAGKKVVIIDMDLRKPKVHKAFGQDSSICGMSTLLINKHNLNDCIVKSDFENLDYIGAGPVPPNPSELILRKTYDEILGQLKEIYDVILIDTPPIGIVTDGLLVMQKADIPIYVFRANYSKLSFIDNVNRLMATGRFPNLTVVLNNVSTRKNGYGYSYGDVYSGSSYYDD
jgi:tyrosine-protein kinase Etk/Wzc